jgi:hypothetical protein
LNFVHPVPSAARASVVIVTTVGHPGVVEPCRWALSRRALGGRQSNRQGWEAPDYHKPPRRAPGRCWGPSWVPPSEAMPRKGPGSLCERSAGLGGTPATTNLHGELLDDAGGLPDALASEVVPWGEAWTRFGGHPGGKPGCASPRLVGSRRCTRRTSAGMDSGTRLNLVVLVHVHKKPARGLSA